jgi:hypothetical protein
MYDSETGQGIASGDDMLDVSSISDDVWTDLETAQFVRSDTRLRSIHSLQPEVTLPFRESATGLVLVSVLRDLRLLNVSLGLHFEAITPDELIFLQRAIKWDRTPEASTKIAVTGLPPGAGSGSALDRLARAVFGEVADSPINEDGTIIEIRQPFEPDIEAWIAANPTPLYGILSGDEGWRWVPEEVAKDRLRFTWSTRTFVKSVALDRTLLQVSSRPATYATEVNQQFEAYGYDLPAHLRIGSAVPGLENGGLFAMEGMIARSVTIKELEAAATEFSLAQSPTGSIGTFLRSIFNSNAAAASLHYTLADRLARIAEPPWWELGQLDRMLRAAFDLERRIERLKWWLGLADAAVHLRYQARMNNLLILLTIVIAAIEIAAAILS